MADGGSAGARGSEGPTRAAALERRVEGLLAGGSAASAAGNGRGDRLRALHEAALVLAMPVAAEPGAVAALLVGVLARAVAAVGGRNGRLVLVEDPAWSEVVEGGPSAGHVVVAETGRLRRRPVTPGGSSEHALVSGTAVYVPDTSAPSPFGDYRELAARGIGAFVVVPLRIGGRALGVLSVNFFRPYSVQTDDREILELFAAHAAAALERTRLGYAERRARTEVEAAQRRLAFLAGASRELATSLSFEETLHNLVRLAVPALADWCTIDVLEGQTIRRLEIAHVDPAKETLLRELRDRYPHALDAPHGVPFVLRTGQPVLTPSIDDGQLAAHARDEEHLRLVRSLGPRSSVTVPLVARGTVLGALSLGSSQAGRFGREDLALAEEFARRAAHAVENAQLYEEARRAVRLRDDFLSVAAHELKTPMTGLRGYTQLALRRLERDGAVAPATLQRYMGAIDAQTERLSRLVAHLLDVSRIEAGKLVLEQTEVDVERLVPDLVHTVQGTTDQHTLVVRPVARAQAGTLWARADTLRLEQVVFNLLDNAIKYSPGGGTIEVAVAARGRKAVRISVRDYGLGIPEEHRERIFERFYQAHGSGNLAGGGHRSGFGLGLYLSHQILELHGGSLTAEFPRGGGTRFVATLPRARRPASPDARPARGR